MGKVLRRLCTITPVALTASSLILLLFVTVGQLSHDNKAPLTLLGRDLYFLKATTKTITTGAQIVLEKRGVSEKLDVGIALPEKVHNDTSPRALSDVYLIGLWSYCKGDRVERVETITYCSSPTTQFWFDAADLWGLKKSSLQGTLGFDLKKATGWLRWAFIIATTLTAVEFAMCFSAMSHRLGSLFTVILSASSSLFAIAAAVTATAVYGVLSGVFRAHSDSYNVDVSMGIGMLLVLWSGVGLGVLSILFWLPSICCCKA